LDSDEEVDAWIRASSHSGARVHPEWRQHFFFGPVSSFQVMSCLGSLVICSLLLFCKGYVAKIGVSGKDVYHQYMFFSKGELMKQWMDWGFPDQYCPFRKNGGRFGILGGSSQSATD